MTSLTKREKLCLCSQGRSSRCTEDWAQSTCSKKNGRLFFFTRMRPGQNDRKHPLLVLLSVLCKSLQRSLIFIALPFSAYALFGKAGAKIRRFLIPSKCFERKVCESWQFFALFYKIRVERGYFWGKGRKKGKAVVREQAVYICHYREISVPLSFNYFLLIIYRGRKDEKKGQDGQRKGADGGKSLAYPFRGRPKSLRQSFGMVSGSVRDGKRYADKWISHARELT